MNKNQLNHKLHHVFSILFHLWTQYAYCVTFLCEYFIITSLWRAGMNKIRFPGVLADAECGVTEYPASSYPSLDIYFVPLVQNTSRRLSPAHTSHVTVSLLVLVLVWLPSKDLCQLSSLPWAPVSFAIQNLLCRKPLREKFSAPSYQTKYAS